MKHSKLMRATAGVLCLALIGTDPVWPALGSAEGRVPSAESRLPQSSALRTQDSALFLLEALTPRQASAFTGHEAAVAVYGDGAQLSRRALLLGGSALPALAQPPAPKAGEGSPAPVRTLLRRLAPLPRADLLQNAWHTGTPTLADAASYDMLLPRLVDASPEVRAAWLDLLAALEAFNAAHSRNSAFSVTLQQQNARFVTSEGVFRIGDAIGQTSFRLEGPVKRVETMEPVQGPFWSAFWSMFKNAVKGVQVRSDSLIARSWQETHLALIDLHRSYAAMEETLDRLMIGDDRQRRQGALDAWFDLSACDLEIRRQRWELEVLRKRIRALQAELGRERGEGSRALDASRAALERERDRAEKSLLALTEGERPRRLAALQTFIVWDTRREPGIDQPLVPNAPALAMPPIPLSRDAAQTLARQLAEPDLLGRPVDTRDLSSPALRKALLDELWNAGAPGPSLLAPAAGPADRRLSLERLRAMASLPPDSFRATAALSPFEKSQRFRIARLAQMIEGLKLFKVGAWLFEASLLRLGVQYEKPAQTGSTDAMIRSLEFAAESIKARIALDRNLNDTAIAAAHRELSGALAQVDQALHEAARLGEELARQTEGPTQTIAGRSFRVRGPYLDTAISLERQRYKIEEALLAAERAFERIKYLQSGRHALESLLLSHIETLMPAVDKLRTPPPGPDADTPPAKQEPKKRGLFKRLAGSIAPIVILAVAAALPAVAGTPAQNAAPAYSADSISSLAASLAAWLPMASALALGLSTSAIEALAGRPFLRRVLRLLQLAGLAGLGLTGSAETLLWSSAAGLVMLAIGLPRRLKNGGADRPLFYRGFTLAAGIAFGLLLPAEPAVRVTAALALTAAAWLTMPRMEQQYPPRTPMLWVVRQLNRQRFLAAALSALGLVYLGAGAIGALKPAAQAVGANIFQRVTTVPDGQGAIGIKLVREILPYNAPPNESGVIVRSPRIGPRGSRIASGTRLVAWVGPDDAALAKRLMAMNTQLQAQGVSTLLNAAAFAAPSDAPFVIRSDRAPGSVDARLEDELLSLENTLTTARAARAEAGAGARTTADLERSRIALEAAIGRFNALVKEFEARHEPVRRDIVLSAAAPPAAVNTPVTAGQAIVLSLMDAPTTVELNLVFTPDELLSLAAGWNDPSRKAAMKLRNTASGKTLTIPLEHLWSLEPLELNGALSPFVYNPATGAIPQVRVRAIIELSEAEQWFGSTPPLAWAGLFETGASGETPLVERLGEDEILGFLRLEAAPAPAPRETIRAAVLPAQLESLNAEIAVLNRQLDSALEEYAKTLARRGHSDTIELSDRIRRRAETLERDLQERKLALAGLRSHQTAVASRGLSIGPAELERLGPNETWTYAAHPLSRSRNPWSGRRAMLWPAEAAALKEFAWTDADPNRLLQAGPLVTLTAGADVRTTGDFGAGIYPVTLPGRRESIAFTREEERTVREGRLNWATMAIRAQIPVDQARKIFRRPASLYPVKIKLPGFTQSKQPAQTIPMNSAAFGGLAFLEPEKLQALWNAAGAQIAQHPWAAAVSALLLGAMLYSIFSKPRPPEPAHPANPAPAHPDLEFVPPQESVWVPRWVDHPDGDPIPAPAAMDASELDTFSEMLRTTYTRRERTGAKGLPLRPDEMLMKRFAHEGLMPPMAQTFAAYHAHQKRRDAANWKTTHNQWIQIVAAAFLGVMALVPGTFDTLRRGFEASNLIFQVLARQASWSGSAVDVPAAAVFFLVVITSTFLITAVLKPIAENIPTIRWNWEEFYFKRIKRIDSLREHFRGMTRDLDPKGIGYDAIEILEQDEMARDLLGTDRFEEYFERFAASISGRVVERFRSEPAPSSTARLWAYILKEYARKPLVPEGSILERDTIEFPSDDMLDRIAGTPDPTPEDRERALIRWAIEETARHPIPAFIALWSHGLTGLAEVRGLPQHGRMETLLDDLTLRFSTLAPDAYDRYREYSRYVLMHQTISALDRLLDRGPSPAQARRLRERLGPLLKKESSEGLPGFEPIALEYYFRGRRWPEEALKSKIQAHQRRITPEQIRTQAGQILHAKGLPELARAQVETQVREGLPAEIRRRITESIASPAVRIFMAWASRRLLKDDPDQFDDLRKIVRAAGADPRDIHFLEDPSFLLSRSEDGQPEFKTTNADLWAAHIVGLSLFTDLADHFEHAGVTLAGDLDTYLDAALAVNRRQSVLAMRDLARLASGQAHLAGMTKRLLHFIEEVRRRLPWRLGPEVSRRIQPLTKEQTAAALPRAAEGRGALFISSVEPDNTAVFLDPAKADPRASLMLPPNPFLLYPALALSGVTLFAQQHPDIPTSFKRRLADLSGFLSRMHVNVRMFEEWTDEILRLIPAEDSQNTFNSILFIPPGIRRTSPRAAAASA